MKSSPIAIERWRRIVEAFDRCTMTREAYCRRVHIKTHQLDYWRRKFARTSDDASSLVSEWVPVQIREENQTEAAPSIRLRIGRVEIEVAPGFDRQLLAEVIRSVGVVC